MTQVTAEISANSCVVTVRSSSSSELIVHCLVLGMEGSQLSGSIRGSVPATGLMCNYQETPLVPVQDRITRLRLGDSMDTLSRQERLFLDGETGNEIQPRTSPGVPSVITNKALLIEQLSPHLSTTGSDVSAWDYKKVSVTLTTSR